MALWMDHKHPGGTARVLTLKLSTAEGNDYEIGDVRIQVYGEQSFRVGTFLPGVYHCSPGDTGKTEPEKCEWVKTTYKADEVFDQYVQEAYEAGWQNYA